MLVRTIRWLSTVYNGQRAGRHSTLLSVIVYSDEGLYAKHREQSPQTIHPLSRLLP